MYNYIFARSFKKREQKQLKFKWMALVCFSLIALSLCAMFKPYLGPLPAACKFALQIVLN